MWTRSQPPPNARLEADRPSVKFLLGMVRLGQRRLDEALTLLRQVPASDPYYAAAQAQLRVFSPFLCCSV